MTALLIVLAVLVVGVLIALVATIPAVRKKEDAAIAKCWDALGRENIVMIEPRTTAMGFDPVDTSAVKAMTCLAATKDELMAVSFAKLDEWRIERSAISKVDTEASDPAAASTASILITYAGPTGDVVARFRIKQPVPWLTELGYDWGPEGPPVLDEDDED
jgi:hypothetical protein